MLTADAEFRAAANAALAAWQNQPPYIAYRVDVNVNIPAMKENRTISRAVEARTSDDRAVLQDLPQGQNQIGQSFPLIPTFDALSYFRIDFHLGDPIRRHNPLSGVHMYQPLKFSDPVASNPDAAVVVTSLRNYYAHYADDSTDRLAHITMDPLPALTRGNDSDFYIHDVYVDTQTLLPSRVIYHGPTTDFEIDYTMVGNRWLVDHAFYKKTVVGPLHIGQTTFTVDAHFAGFTFPDQPKDARLRP
jgi:hypothetical protein